MRFHYKDKVKVIKGFYTGSEGIVIDYFPRQKTAYWFFKNKSIGLRYLVSFGNYYDYHGFNEDELEKVAE